MSTKAAHGEKASRLTGWASSSEPGAALQALQLPAMCLQWQPDRICCAIRFRCESLLSSHLVNILYNGYVQSACSRETPRYHLRGELPQRGETHSSVGIPWFLTYSCTQRSKARQHFWCTVKVGYYVSKRHKNNSSLNAGVEREVSCFGSLFALFQREPGWERYLTTTLPEPLSLLFR